MWLQRPPTALYWRRGWEAFFKRPYRKQNAVNWFKRVIAAFALNHFIWLRGKYRWLAHWLIMWGCIIAALITFPLVFGWLMFESVPGDLDRAIACLLNIRGGDSNLQQERLELEIASHLADAKASREQAAFEAL